MTKLIKGYKNENLTDFMIELHEVEKRKLHILEQNKIIFRLNLYTYFFESVL